MRSVILAFLVCVPAWALSPEFIGAWFTRVQPFETVTIEEGVSNGIDAVMSTATSSSGPATLLACKETLEAGKLPRLDCESEISDPPFTAQLELQSLTEGVLRYSTQAGAPTQLSKRVNNPVPASSHTGLAPEFLKKWAHDSSSSFEDNIVVEESLGPVPALVVSGRLFVNQRQVGIFAICYPHDGSKTRVFCSSLTSPVKEDALGSLTALPFEPIFYLDLLSKSFMKFEYLKSVEGTAGPQWLKLSLQATT